MSTAPTTQAEQEDAVREALIAALNQTFRGFSFPGGRWSTGFGAEMAADALLAGPIATLRTERDQLAADLRKAREERDAHFMSLAAATCELMRGAHSGGAEIQALRKVCLLQARELKRLDPDGDTPVDLNAAMEKLRAALTPDPNDAGGTAKGEDHGA